MTLAAFLLTGGRLSDMFSAKWTFTIGFAWLGAFSLGLGFVDKKNTFIALRSLQGIGAALTVRPVLSVTLLCEEALTQQQFPCELSSLRSRRLSG